MSWYLWIVTVVLALNGLVLVLVALFLLFDWLRSRKQEQDIDLESARKDSEHSESRH